MSLIRKLFRHLRELNRYAKRIIFTGLFLSLAFYIIGFSAQLAAPYVEDYHYAMAVYRGCIDVAPTTFSVGFCAGILAHGMIRRSEDEKPDQK